MLENLFLRCVVQRAKHAEVLIEGNSQGKMDQGLVILLGIGFKEIQADISEENVPHVLKQFIPSMEKLAEKLVSLRIFEDSEGKMNLSVKDFGGGIYIISQFTLFGDCRKGNRPSFTMSAKPLLAKPIYEKFLDILNLKYEKSLVYSGVFAADMKVSFCNDGPVTLVFDSGIKGIM
ncbi:D-aminoacyl-tRNA deacylase [Silvanigrella aquatica]|uniref:D-aminoacyl-tRNA deacylase n=1 Tax=Silvanigrella aquatica TaxID=1915309 RepID=A0A1L4D121_9BACT|nr:D-aminoacyl-tRNA deacylase [Silvanigrella aquatica]APJ03888.1 D-tyrosyl-tRNA(Tyr) deacylase [Silvanigrella aquatica]